MNPLLPLVFPYTVLLLDWEIINDGFNDKIDGVRIVTFDKHKCRPPRQIHASFMVNAVKRNHDVLSHKKHGNKVPHGLSENIAVATFGVKIMIDYPLGKIEFKHYAMGNSSEGRSRSHLRPDLNPTQNLTALPSEYPTSKEIRTPRHSSWWSNSFNNISPKKAVVRRVRNIRRLVQLICLALNILFITAADYKAWIQAAPIYVQVATLELLSDGMINRDGAASPVRATTTPQVLSCLPLALSIRVSLSEEMSLLAAVSRYNSPDRPSSCSFLFASVVETTLMEDLLHVSVERLAIPSPPVETCCSLSISPATSSSSASVKAISTFLPPSWSDNNTPKPPKSSTAHSPNEMTSVTTESEPASIAVDTLEGPSTTTVLQENLGDGRLLTDTLLSAPAMSPERAPRPTDESDSKKYAAATASGTTTLLILGKNIPVLVVEPANRQLDRLLRTRRLRAPPSYMRPTTASLARCVASPTDGSVDAPSKSAPRLSRSSPASHASTPPATHLASKQAVPKDDFSNTAPKMCSFVPDKVCISTSSRSVPTFPAKPPAKITTTTATTTTKPTTPAIIRTGRSDRREAAAVAAHIQRIASLDAKKGRDVSATSPALRSRWPSVAFE
ncbi:hypothetical protein BDK51DRAFT_32810 [Blyttiomyces helicus]|uniref:Uncharacterized protein n=1 Tax=Blyttiomyces helicus TaxID=388810 RepID=A0A4P9WJN0_9FUNG|nr:hypothetical protein BDK51DRAFT_32810 [Blyttiomyces helicus]|eukprot:RKO93149.1 hypothetical protein BDK51DRAFT_32810 [Blyttiomyces helicus]